jgi:hypothetical protein
MLRFLFLAVLFSLPLKVHAGEIFINHCNSQTQKCLIESFNSETKSSTILVKDDETISETWKQFPVSKISEEEFNGLQNISVVSYTYDYKNGKTYYHVCDEKVDAGCIAGTVGSAMLGGLAGASSGPIGVTIGVVGGALAGSAASGCWQRTGH